MSHSSGAHRDLDNRFADALARNGEPVSRGAVLPSRLRGKDMKTMNGPPQAKVLLATLSECTSGRGKTYLRGWAGASNLVGFRGDDDEQGRPTWQLFLVERQPRDGTPASPQRSQGSEAAHGRPGAPHAPVARRGGSYRPPRPESASARRERVSAEIARGLGVHSDADLNDEIGF